MLISFGYDISLRLEVETAVLFCLRVHPSRTEDIVSGENFRIEPQSPFEQYLDGFGNIEMAKMYGESLLLNERKTNLGSFDKRGNKVR
jgi:hypothetical protein